MIVQVKAVRPSPVYIETGAAAGVPIKTVPGGTSGGSGSSGSRSSASAPAWINLVVFQKYSDNKEQQNCGSDTKHPKQDFGHINEDKRYSRWLGGILLCVLLGFIGAV